MLTLVIPDIIFNQFFVNVMWLITSLPLHQKVANLRFVRRNIIYGETIFVSLGPSRLFASEFPGFCFFFSCKITNSATRGRKRYNFKTTTVETWNLEVGWDTYGPFFVQILGAISYVIRVSEPKPEMPIEGLNSSSWKTNCSRRITFSNLEAPGNAGSAPKFELRRSDTIFFFFIYLITFLLGTKTPRPPKLRSWNVEIWRPKNEVVLLHFWRRYVTWFGADAPKT